MKKIKLTETELTNLIKRVIIQEEEGLPAERDGCQCCRDLVAKVGTKALTASGGQGGGCCKYCKPGKSVKGPAMTSIQMMNETDGCNGPKWCPCCMTGYEQACKDCWREQNKPYDKMGEKYSDIEKQMGTKDNEITESDLKRIVKKVIKEQSGPNWQTVQQQWAGGVPPSPPQAFLNNMANMGCAGMNSRLTVLYNKLTNQLGGGGGPQGVSGTHPLWQSQLASKIYWLAYEGIPNC
tara:strand:+ start:8489 stop:9199 length:711 start_codon:yes stop_codon:yes gene_type:complete